MIAAPERHPWYSFDRVVAVTALEGKLELVVELILLLACVTMARLDTVGGTAAAFSRHLLGCWLYSSLSDEVFDRLRPSYCIYQKDGYLLEFF